MRTSGCAGIVACAAAFSFFRVQRDCDRRRPHTFGHAYIKWVYVTYDKRQELNEGLKLEEEPHVYSGPEIAKPRCSKLASSSCHCFMVTIQATVIAATQNQVSSSIQARRKLPSPPSQSRKAARRLPTSRPDGSSVQPARGRADEDRQPDEDHDRDRRDRDTAIG